MKLFYILPFNVLMILIYMFIYFEAILSHFLGYQILGMAMILNGIVIQYGFTRIIIDRYNIISNLNGDKCN